MSRSWKIGTRASPLALHQAQEVLRLLRQGRPNVELTLVPVKSHGDVIEGPLTSSSSRGVFVKELENALLVGYIDMAVHSLKDLPTELPEGLALGAIPSRADPRDVLVSRHRCSLDQLPRGATLGTGSPRRAGQIKAYRQDLKLLPMRGNVDTRVRKALEGPMDGAILAAAGVLRLGLEKEIAQYLSTELCLPAPGQGALAVEARAGDGETMGLLAAIDGVNVRAATEAERSFLEGLGGGCRVPVGALGRVVGGLLELEGVVASEDGTAMLRARATGTPDAARDVGLELARRLLAMGAGEL